jgi:hypothetical protein
MQIFGSSVNFWRRRVQWAALILICGVLTAKEAALAQTPPYALFQYSTLTASGNTVTATSVPV